jgi:hypothetical protein
LLSFPKWEYPFLPPEVLHILLFLSKKKATEISVAFSLSS